MINLLSPAFARRFAAIAASLIILGAATVLSAAEPAPLDPQIEASITKNAEAFIAAFKKGDAKAVAAFWAPDGDYLNVDQEHFQGREEIEKVFAKNFALSKGQSIRIEVQGAYSPAADVVIEDGIASILTEDGLPTASSHYTNVHVKKDGKWYLQSVREAPHVVKSNYSRLSGLEWIIGEWKQSGKPGSSAQILFEWAPEKNFIVGYQQVAINGVVLSSGSERIGWDPVAKQIHSWNFQSSGGFGEGVWTLGKEDSWSVAITSVLADGRKVTATNTLTRKNADTVVLQFKSQMLDGKALPDTEEITLERVK
ncbi:MAG: SgcJ/EcaC family oxidoreductase [Candidatus Methylacidiphilales bacterium]|nr:SgcJ/EcaC family oxidoreductase [Candidatus Methylacidiphilales bacterium]